MIEKVFSVKPIYRYYINGIETCFSFNSLKDCFYTDVARFYDVSVDSITSRLIGAELCFTNIIKL